MNPDDKTCGCCEGVEEITPEKIANRPGLPVLAYRVGSYATFLETMLARLSGHYLETTTESGETRRLRPLSRLRTRDGDDPAIAFLDAWATVAEVLSFYQERIANEGFLRTATERRSILELARLVGYRLRPGVAASVYLAFEIEKEQSFSIALAGVTEERDRRLVIPRGTRAQSLPRGDELPQFFETSHDLEARYVWSKLKPRQTLPAVIHKKDNHGLTWPDGREVETIYFKGIATNLKANDPLLFVFGEGKDQQVLRFVESVEAQPEFDRTKVRLNTSKQPRLSIATPKKTPFEKLRQVINPLLRDPSHQPQNPLRRPISARRAFAPLADIAPQLLVAQNPVLRGALYNAWREAATTALPTLRSVHAFRVKTAPFGHNAPPKTICRMQGNECVPVGNVENEKDDWDLLDPVNSGTTIHLDTTYDEIVPGSWVVIKRPDGENIRVIFAQVKTVETVTRTAYNISAKVTKLELGTTWLPTVSGTKITLLRKTEVFVQSEPLELAPQPIDEDVRGSRIELDGFFDGLEPGRWLMISGERTDITPGSIADNVRASELVMVIGVTQGPHLLENGNELPGDTLHTTLHLANDLAYTYKRDTVTINANVAHATHGETREEILGSGDSRKAFQQFRLSAAPLTYVAAPTAAGIASTLHVRVNEVERQEADTLFELQPGESKYITSQDSEGNTFIVFGNGEHGARLPTGIENVQARYRTGLGKAGNVAAEQISQLVGPPAGVRSVINPRPATGGADPDSLDDARRNVPVELLALGRAVSIQDYADFARAFTGIGKALAVEISDGRREIVHLTIAGAGNIPIDRNSDLFRNLQGALLQFGDPHQPLELAIRELLLIVISARVKLLPGYQWEGVEPQIRAALLECFGFERRDFGQDVVLGEVITTIQSLTGVDYVDVDLLDALGEIQLQESKNLGDLFEEFTQNGKKQPLQRIDVKKTHIDEKKRLRPAQLAILTPEVPDTLLLREII